MTPTAFYSTHKDYQSLFRQLRDSLFERNDDLSERVSGEEIEEGLACIVDTLYDVFLDPVAKVASIGGTN